MRKTPTEDELLRLLRAGEVQLPPLALKVKARTRTRADDGDTFLDLEWGGQRYRFVATCKRLGTPKAISEMIAQAQRDARPPELYPLVVVPYLPDARLAELESAGVSGIDLCGNGVVVVPNEILVYRTGCPNVFRSEAEIKNVFRGDSSLVGRSFLVAPEYGSVQDVGREIEKRGGKLALSTISKVCKSLVGMLVIERKREKGSAAQKLRLLQPDKLLDLLAANYVAPPTTRNIRGKTKLTAEALCGVLTRMGKGGTVVVQTGFSSVGSYAVMAKEPVRYFYCSDLDAVLRELGDRFEPTDQFANLSLSETRDATVYFDRRSGLVASPVQAYLELATGDKRSRETAEQVRRVILAPPDKRGS